MPSQYSYQLSISLHKENPLTLEIVRNVLMNFGISPQQTTELVQDKRTYFLLYFPNSNALKKISKRLQASTIKGLCISAERLKRKEWETKWKEDFRPFQLTAGFAVVPVWFRKTYDSKKLTPVYIDTGLAFGTGLHPTTRYLSEFIESYRGKLDRFLDLGTGTGILAIIASLCGAQDILAIDLTDDCITTAKKNLKHNRINNIKLLKRNVYHFSINKKYDFVAANLSTDVLLDIKSKLISFVKTNGHLALSGVSIHNTPKLLKAFGSPKLRLIKIKKAEGWSAFLYKKLA